MNTKELQEKVDTLVLLVDCLTKHNPVNSQELIIADIRKIAKDLIELKELD